MPVGVIVNSISIFAGGLLGAMLGNAIPERLRQTLPLIFGVASMTMGSVSMVKLQALPAVILALIIGTSLGELINVEKAIERAAAKIRVVIETLLPGRGGRDNQEDFMEQFVGVLVLFCVSGTGVFGALQSGMTGDHTILLTKSILDLFTAAVFAASLGVIVSLIVIPQFIVMMALFLSAAVIMPLATPAMLADFTATGGVLMLATGFRISGIRSFPIANMLPAMLLVMPISFLWTKYLM
ncbi:MAG: DUF554 domain-containing protein [Sporomusaceae bacterium]|nr:DUF554 domain-containing protein [Sporomusaceae bacterium]